MKKTLFMIALAVIFSGNVSAREGNPRRVVLFTLEEHEEVFENTYAVLPSGNGYRFACMTVSALDGNNVVIFNGKRVFPMDANPMGKYAAGTTTCGRELHLHVQGEPTTTRPSVSPPASELHLHVQGEREIVREYQRECQRRL